MPFGPDRATFTFSTRRAESGAARPISEWGSPRFGFGRPTGIDLPGERGGNLPIYAAPQGVERRVARSNGDALQLAIGQARLTATPLQVARLLAAVANGGKLVVPKLVDSAGPAMVAVNGSESSAATASETRIPELSSRTLGVVRRGLSQVVASPHGTGYKTVRLNEVAIARGKRGTAEAGGGKPDHAWFAGYVPADRPKNRICRRSPRKRWLRRPRRRSVARKLVQAFIASGLLDGPTTCPLRLRIECGFARPVGFPSHTSPKRQRGSAVRDPAD